MAANLKDVSELAGVSRSAVSRAFTEGAPVSAKTREKVLRAAKQLGYSPNLLARSLTTRRTKLIGLALNNFHNPIFLEVFDLFTRRLQERGYRPLIVNITEDYDPKKLLKMMREYSVDGVIIASSTLSPDYALIFRHNNLPVVQAFGRATETTVVNTVGVDNRHCGRLAAQHLIALGYESIVFLGGPATASTTIDRWEGFRQAAESAPNVTASVTYADSYLFEAGRTAMQKILRTQHAQAYFCGDDILSLGAISAIRDAGLKIPEDIGLIGVNDMEMSGWPGIDLTTVRQPIREIISGSVDLMISTLEEPARYPELRLFPCQIIERKTLPLLKALA